MKCKKKFKGAISVFMAIIYLTVFILEALLVDGGRMRIAEAEAEAAQQMANESIMTLYNQALYQYYDLFGETKYKPDDVKSTVQEMMKAQLGTDSSGSYNTRQKISATSIIKGERHFDPFKFKIKNLTLGSNLNLADEKVFVSQISDSMKYKGPILLAQNFFDILGKMGGTNDTIKAVHESSKKVEGVYKDYGDFCDKIDKLLEDIEKFRNDPTGQGKGADMRDYANKVGGEIKSSLESSMTEIDNCSKAIFELNKEKLELTEEESEEDADARAKKIEELQKKKDEIVQNSITDITKKGNEFLANMQHIENRLNDVEDPKILGRLKELDDLGASYVGEGSNVVKSTLYLNESENNVKEGDYSKDQKDIYKGFKEGVNGVKEKIKSTRGNIRIYSDRLKEKMFTPAPSHSEIKTYVEKEILKSAIKVIQKYRDDSKEHESSDTEEMGDYKDQDHTKYKMDKEFLSGKIEQYVGKVKKVTDYMAQPDKPLDEYFKDIRENRKKWEQRENENVDTTKPNNKILEENPEGRKLANKAKDKTYKGPDVTSSTHKLGKISSRKKSKDNDSKKIKEPQKDGKADKAKEDNAKEISNLSDKIGEILANGVDSLFECAYVMSYFRDYVHVGKMKSEHIKDKKYDTVLNTKFLDGIDESEVSYLTAEQFKNIEVSCAEIEYVLYGFEDTKKDVAAVYADIYIKRLALDYVSVWLTPELRKIVMEAAASAGPAAPAVIALLPLAFSVPRSILDMEIIMSGKKSPLLYTKIEDWASVGESWKEDKLLCGYGDYLLLGLLLDGNKTERMMDVVETNMKVLDSKFTLKDALVNMYIDSECSVDHLFMAQPFIPAQLKQGSQHTFKIGTSYSY